MDYQQALTILHQLQRAGISPGLERIEELCRRLGHPERHLKHVIHITGTNGKGSVAAMLDAVLRAAGKTTALFTSPHLYCHAERYRVNGVPISQQRFAELFAVVYREHQAMVADGFAPPTEFETVTALALLWFATENVDHAIIEVGLGGLTDSTNVVSGDINIITNVALDHSDFLGDTIAAVAHHKAGIIKPNSLVVTAATGEALAIIAAKAKEQQAKLYVEGQDFTYKPVLLNRAGSIADITTNLHSYQQVAVALLAEHQLINAAIAVQAAELLGIDEQSIRSGLAAVKWPGRLEMISEQPLILLDGAHNYAGMQALCAALDRLWAKEKIFCVLGMLSDKEREKSLRLLLPYVERFIITRPPYLSRSEDWQILADLCRESGKKAETIADNGQAIEQALSAVNDDEMILVCGSLYMVAEVRKYLFEETNLCSLREDK